jgi:GntR family transcriptional regulator
MGLQGLFNRPLYLQVRDSLAERIATGKWKPGDAIPNETELAREMGVSPGTMRKSLDLLEAEHLVTRRQGRGTFVKDQRDLAHRFNRLRSQDRKTAGNEAKTLDITLGECSEPECARLQLVRGEQVYRIRRSRSQLGEVFMIETASLPAAIFPDLLERTLPSHVLLDVAMAYGLLLGDGQERISLALPSTVAAEALNLAPGARVLLLDRVIKTRDGRPAEWRRAECNMKRLHYQAEMV